MKPPTLFFIVLALFCPVVSGVCSQYLTTCTFYPCLDLQHPCPVDNNYLLDFGEKYCRAFTAELTRFTPRGQVWINSTKVCLERALQTITTALPDSGVYCSSLRAKAFASHVPCYVNPVLNDPAITVCKLPVPDLILLANTIAPIFQQFQTAFEALKETRAVMAACGAEYYRELRLDFEREIDSKEVKETLDSIFGTAVGLVTPLGHHQPSTTTTTSLQAAKSHLISLFGSPALPTDETAKSLSGAFTSGRLSRLGAKQLHDCGLACAADS